MIVGSLGRETQGVVHPLLELVRVEMSVELLLSLPVEQEEGRMDGVGAPLTVAVPLIPPDLLAWEVMLGVVEGSEDGLPTTPKDGDTLGEEEALPLAAELGVSPNAGVEVTLVVAEDEA